MQCYRRKKKILRKEVKVCSFSQALYTHTHIRMHCSMSTLLSLRHTGTLVQVKIKMLPFVTPVPEPAD